MMGVASGTVVQNDWGWSPVMAAHNVAVMSVAFMLNASTMPVVWRGPRKTQMILRYLRDVYWGQLDYLSALASLSLSVSSLLVLRSVPVVIDTPPGTSDEHMTVTTALK